MLQARVLGCGSSGGVPRIGGDWGVCDPSEPKNRRTRCSILVRYREDGADGVTQVLVDTSPDLREQLLAADTRRIDAVVYTHDHADQSHGIDDIRALAYRMGGQVPCWMDAPTRDNLLARFGYCFETPEGRAHPPILDLQDVMEDAVPFEVTGPGGTLRIEPFVATHGPGPTLGLVFDGRLAYSPDVHGIADTTLDRLRGVETWICDALRYHPHPTHAHADRTLMWQARTGVPHMVLTNLHIDMDYATLSEELPGGQSLAWDGREVTV